MVLALVLRRDMIKEALDKLFKIKSLLVNSLQSETNPFMFIYKL